MIERYLIERYLYVGLGGGIGALCRYALLGVNQNEPGVFPYSTILVNIVGAFLLTFLLNLNVFDLKIDREIQLAIIVGTIGSFTTFSLIMTDMISLLGTPWLFTMYYLVTIVGGLVASFIAYLLALYFNKRGDLA